MKIKYEDIEIEQTTTKGEDNVKITIADMSTIHCKRLELDIALNLLDNAIEMKKKQESKDFSMNYSDEYGG